VHVTGVGEVAPETEPYELVLNALSFDIRHCRYDGIYVRRDSRPAKGRMGLQDGCDRATDEDNSLPKVAERLGY
jgi:hypothetical protein